MSKQPKWVKELDKKIQKETGISYMNMINNFYPTIFDHYYFEDNKVIGEPYGIFMERIEPFIQFCKENNLTFRIESNAKHHPDCVRIVVKPKEA